MTKFNNHSKHFPLLLQKSLLSVFSRISFFNTVKGSMEMIAAVDDLLFKQLLHFLEEVNRHERIFRIAIYGSAREQSLFDQKVLKKISFLLNVLRFDIVEGGGPGVMALVRNLAIKEECLDFIQDSFSIKTKEIATFRYNLCINVGEDIEHFLNLENQKKINSAKNNKYKWVVVSFLSRLQLFATLADCAIAWPGGIGTNLEICTMMQLGQMSQKKVGDIFSLSSLKKVTNWGLSKLKLVCPSTLPLIPKTILVGSFWEFFIKHLKRQVACNKASTTDLDLIDFLNDGAEYDKATDTLLLEKGYDVDGEELFIPVELFPNFSDTDKYAISVVWHILNQFYDWYDKSEEVAISTSCICEKKLTKEEFHKEAKEWLAKMSEMVFYPENFTND